MNFSQILQEAVVIFDANGSGILGGILWEVEVLAAGELSFEL